MQPLDELKQQVAKYAVDQFVHSDMVIGLGSGSTAVHAVRYIGQKLQSGAFTNIKAIACSQWIENEARQSNIPITTFEENHTLDLTIDGADEVDSENNLIKGGGGALLREKIVALASRREIIIIDNSKLSPQLGTHWAVPIEVIPFGWIQQKHYLEMLGATVTLRSEQNGRIFVTDQGNYILDAQFGAIGNPRDLAAKLKQQTGIVEHGLFVGIATDVLIIFPDGRIEYHQTEK